MDTQVAIDIALFFVKITLVCYITLSVWWPLRSVNHTLNSVAGKAVLLLAVVISSMFDVPLAVLITVTMILAILSDEVAPEVPKAEQKAIAVVPKASAPASASAATAKPDANLRIYDPKQESKVPPMPIEDQVVEASAPLTAIDHDIIRMSHVPEDRLANAQTSALDPSLVGYEEETVARVDMPTTLDA